MAQDNIDIGQLYTSFCSYVNTYQGGWYRPNSDFESACNDISNQFWNDYTSEAEKSQEIIDNLRNFLKSENVVVKSQKGNYGTFDMPNDYGRFAAARIITNGKITVEDKAIESLKTDEEKAEEYYEQMKEKTVKKIDNNKWGAVLDHETKFPTLEEPKMTQIKGSFKIAPREISVVAFDYYIKPTPCKFAYTVTEGNPQTGAGDKLVYDKLNSQPLPWPSTMKTNFIIAVGEKFAIFTRDQFLAQASQVKK